MEGASVWALYSLIITSILTPILVGAFQYLVRRAELKHTEDREDAVAKRVFEVSKMAAATSAITIGKLDVIHGQNTQIHDLVNSGKTELLETIYEALKAQLALLREVVRLSTITGETPSPETTNAIRAVTARIADLETTLAERAATLAAMPPPPH